MYSRSDKKTNTILCKRSANWWKRFLQQQQHMLSINNCSNRKLLHDNNEDNDDDTFTYDYHADQLQKQPQQKHYQSKLDHMKISKRQRRISNLSINNRNDFCHLITILLIGILIWDNYLWSGSGGGRGGRAYAAPQSCILCDKNDLKNKNPTSINYEEFLFEHQVTRQDAINALRALNKSFYDGPSLENSCKSVTCTKKVMKYCLGAQFINDHCWCELGHTDEGLPFVPHICYVGEKVYTASVGSCFFYEEVKECCCAPALAKQWRHISAAPSTTCLNSLGKCLSLLVSTLMFSFIIGHILKLPHL